MADTASGPVRGHTADTALREVRGALNPIADPLALDIAAKATDLKLAPLSLYAGKYAGYTIERDLALQRALAVPTALAACGLPVERLLLAARHLRPAGAAAAVAWVPRAELPLATN